MKREDDMDSVDEESKGYNSQSQGGAGSRRGGTKDEWRCLDCNKCYKSYPAFYTHNKLKHAGQPPKNYDIPRSLEDIRKDRGRPRVVKNKLFI